MRLAEDINRSPIPGTLDEADSNAPNMTRGRSGSPARAAASLTFENALALAVSENRDLALWVSEAGGPTDQPYVAAIQAETYRTPRPQEQGRHHVGQGWSVRRKSDIQTSRHRPPSRAGRDGVLRMWTASL